MQHLSEMRPANTILDGRVHHLQQALDTGIL
jgi:hypothetical protein